jgi:hypothetical protein
VKDMNDEIAQDTLGSSLMKSIASDYLSDLSVEITEIAIDSFLADGIAKNLPFYQVYKLVNSIRDVRLMKKTYAFLFEHRNIPLSDRVKFLSQFETENDIREFGELVIALLDRVLQIEKAEVIGKLSRAQVQNRIDKNTFLLLCESTDRLFLPDLEYLKKYKVMKERNNISENEELVHHRLVTAGLMTLRNEMSYLDTPVKMYGEINQLGMKFIQIIFEDK